VKQTPQLDIQYRWRHRSDPRRAVDSTLHSLLNRMNHCIHFRIGSFQHVQFVRWVDNSAPIWTGHDVVHASRRFDRRRLYVPIVVHVVVGFIVSGTIIASNASAYLRITIRTSVIRSVEAYEDDVMLQQLQKKVTKEDLRFRKVVRDKLQMATGWKTLVAG